MPRTARIVCPGVPHHVTQRGVKQMDIFHSDVDRRTYLGLLRKFAERYELTIWAWCLMSNHTHLIVVPKNEGSMACTFRETHGVYAHYRNALDGTTGHAWQLRYYSCPLDRRHLWFAMRYVERNPVRAGLVDLPEQWQWSSARAHLHGRDDFSILDESVWRDAWSPDEWSEFLTQADDNESSERMRSCTRLGHPFGDEAFVEELGRRLDRDFSMKKPGRKPKVATAGIR